MKKRDGRSTPRDALEHYRFQALNLRKKGWKTQKIAEAFDVHPDSVSRWFGKAKRNGETSLKSTKAKGKDPTLNESDKLEIISILKMSATDFGFETPLWTIKRLRQVIKNKLGKSVSTSNLWNRLRKWKLSPQIPEKEYAEKDKKKFNKWLKEEWPKIKELCRRWQAMLYFLDESGVSLSPVVGTTWAPRGKTPKIKVTGKRGGFCITSAISPAGKMLFRIENKKINAQAHIDFLSKIILHHPNRKIIVIEDNATPHIAKLVKEFAMSNKKRIAIFHIPSYSPELNPDEEVWNYLKNVKLKDHQARDKKEFRVLTESKMRSIQREHTRISSFFYKNYSDLIT